MNFKRNLLAILTCFLFIISSIPVSSETSNPEPDDYPNGWTHRPIMEQFTSLGCSPCMGIEPDVAKLWNEFREDPAEPVTFISFHQTNGGSSDDEFVSQESKDRYNFYSVQGTPDAQFDGGYIEELGGGDGTYETYKDHYFESGEREVKPTELRVWQEFREDHFIFTVNLTYLGEGFTEPWNPDILDSSVYLFVVEDDIMAWSSVEGGEVMTHNVFRETALHDEQVELQPGETWSSEIEWTIPDTIMYPSGHEDRDGNPQEGEHPIPTPINPAKVSVVAVVYDNEDTSRTTTAGKTGNSADTPRAANSATPKSTAYDEQNDPPRVVNYDENLNGNVAEISALLEDEDGIGSAYVIYNFHNGSYDDDEWGIMPMQIDENNLATASIEFNGADPVWYRILLVDGKQGFAASDAKQFEGTGKGSVSETTPGFGVFTVTVALLIGLSRRKY